MKTGSEPVKPGTCRRTFLRALSYRNEGEPDHDDALLQCSSGDLPDVSWFMSRLVDEDDRRQERAVTLLADIVDETPEFLDELIRQDALPPLIEVLVKGNMASKELATGIVERMARSKEWGAAFVDAGGVKCLVGSPLTSKNAVRRRLALQSVVKLMKLQGPEVLEQMAEYGAIKPLVNLAMTGDKVERTKSSHALCLLSESGPAIQARLAKEGGIVAMLTLSEALSDKARCFSARGLAKLSESQESGAQIVRLNGIPTLIKLLGDTEEDCRDSSTCALANLSVRARARRKMRRHGAVNALVDILENEKLGTAGMAACALGNMAQEEVNRGVIVDRGAVQFLVDLLESANTRCHVTALAALGNLARSPKPRKAIFKAGGIKLVVEKLDEEDPGKKQHAVRALSNLAITKAHKSYIVSDTDAIKHLVALLEASSMETRRLSARCLAQLAILPENRLPIMEGKAVPGLVELMRGERYRCKEQGVYAISVLLESCKSLRQEPREKIATEVFAQGGAIVTARSMFRQFGSRMIVNGRRVRDDYWESKARKQGFTEEDLAGEKRPGAAKARAAEAANAASILGAPHQIVYNTNPTRYGELPQPQIVQPDLNERSRDYSNLLKVGPRQEITGPPYQDRTQSAPLAEIQQQATHAAEYNESINRSRDARSDYMHNIWRRSHEQPASAATLPQPAATTDSSLPTSRAGTTSSTMPQSGMIPSQSPQMMMTAAPYSQSIHSQTSQTPIRAIPQPPALQKNPRPTTMPGATGSMASYSYGPPGGQMWPPHQTPQTPQHGYGTTYTTQHPQASAHPPQASTPQMRGTAQVPPPMQFSGMPGIGASYTAPGQGIYPTDQQTPRQYMPSAPSTSPAVTQGWSSSQAPAQWWATSQPQ